MCEIEQTRSSLVMRPKISPANALRLACHLVEEPVTVALNKLLKLTSVSSCEVPCAMLIKYQLS